MLIADKEFENASAALEVYQVEHPENMILGQPLVVRSPISGEIIENNIVTGQYLKDDTEPVAIVADLSEVWIAAQVKEKDIPLEYPEMTLFMIIELVSSTVFTSIVEKQPLPIEEFKPHLYKTIRLLINEKLEK